MKKSGCKINIFLKNIRFKNKKNKKQKKKQRIKRKK